MVPESSIIIEYIDRHCPGGTKLIPDDPDLSRQVRFTRVYARTQGRWRVVSAHNTLISKL